jgi:hypothetical protein
VTRRSEQRRLAAVAVAALAVIVASTLAPADSEAASVVAPVGPVAAVHALGAPLPPTTAVKPAPKRTAPRPAAKATSVRPATVAPYRVGTTGYAKWWARRIMTKTYHWSSTGQYQCLVRLWQRESNWLVSAYNRGSGATGIPQAVPGSKMRSAGSDWRTNAVTQIRWGLGYIKHVYGSPCGAWSHSQAHGWY